MGTEQEFWTSGAAHQMTLFPTHYNQSNDNVSIAPVLYLPANTADGATLHNED